MLCSCTYARFKRCWKHAVIWQLPASRRSCLIVLTDRDHIFKVNVRNQIYVIYKSNYLVESVSSCASSSYLNSQIYIRKHNRVTQLVKPPINYRKKNALPQISGCPGSFRIHFERSGSSTDRLVSCYGGEGEQQLRCSAGSCIAM